MPNIVSKCTLSTPARVGGSMNYQFLGFGSIEFEVFGHNEVAQYVLCTVNL